MPNEDTQNRPTVRPTVKAEVKTALLRVLTLSKTGWAMNDEVLLGTFSILLMIAGWFLDRGEKVSWVSHLVAPRYFRAASAYDEMIRSKAPLRKGEAGFEELASLVRKDLAGEGDLTISELQIPDHAFAIMTGDVGMESGPTVTLAVTLQDGRRNVAPTVKDLRPRIREQFLEGSLFAWGAVVFWFGVVGNVVSIGMLSRKKSRP